MKNLTKFLLKEYIVSLLIVLSSLTIIVFIFDIIQFIDELALLSKGKLLFILYRIPHYISYIFPYSIVLSSIFSYCRLSYQFEIIALNTARITDKKIIMMLSLFILLTSLLSFINEGFIAPYTLRKSLILIGKEKPIEEIELQEIALKKDNELIFIESLQKEAKTFNNLVRVILDREDKVEEVLVAKEGLKKGNFLEIKDGKIFTSNGEIKDFTGTVEMNLSTAVINLAYKPKVLTILEMRELDKAVSIYSIDTKRYSHSISKRILHIFIPLLLYLAIVIKIPPFIDDKKRVVTLIKTSFLLILYNIIESNIYNWSLAKRLNMFCPLFICLLMVILFIIGTRRLNSPYL